MADEPQKRQSRRRRRKRRKKLSLFAIVGIVIVLFAPHRGVIPVENATAADWHDDTFWHEPWGDSGVHKGIDIFAPRGTRALASTTGIVVRSGVFGSGGEVVVVLGAKWRLHYYAHLNERSVSAFDWVSRGEPIGTVGTSGNAAGKAPHLHYSILSLIPQPWLFSNSTQGWKRMFYLDPTRYIAADSKQ